MSRTIRGRGRFNVKDGDLQSITKDKRSRKSFLLDSEEKWATKSAGGPGNKRGWKVFIPKWLYYKYKKEHI